MVKMDIRLCLCHVPIDCRMWILQSRCRRQLMRTRCNWCLGLNTAILNSLPHAGGRMTNDSLTRCRLSVA